MSYIGRTGKLSQRAYTKVDFLATAGQTIKTGLSYVAGFVEVHINGLLLTDTVDYTATNGNSVTFVVALNVNDEVTVVSLKTFAVPDTYTKAEADGSFATKANFTSTGIDDNATSTAVTLDSSGNLLVGKTSADGTATTGHDIRATGLAYHTVNGGAVKVLNRTTSDGDIVSFRKDGTTVGSIGTFNDYVTLGSGDTGLLFYNGGDVIRPHNMATNTSRDNAIDLGSSVDRFKDLYLSGGVVFGATGGSVSSKTLDDYEEGTWTPAATQAATYQYQRGFYTKVGNLVTVYGDMGFTGLATSSSVGSIPLPFTAKSVGFFMATTRSCSAIDGMSNSWMPTAYTSGANLNIQLLHLTSGVESNGSWKSAGRYNFQVTYEVA